MMIERAALSQLVTLPDRDISYVLSTLLRRPSKGAVTAGELLALLVYDLLRSTGFSVEAASAILLQFQKELMDLGRVYGAAQPGDSVESLLLQIMDNRYACISTPEAPGTIFDFIESVEVQQPRTPVLSLVLVLPELWTRSVLVLERAQRQRGATEVPPAPESEQTAGS